jgi:hypothetical protein
MSRELLQQALNALEYHTMQTRPINHTDKAIEAIKQELAKPEQEPVAWIGDADYVKGQFVEGRVRRVWWECNTGVGQPLYTAPPRKEWVGLTNEDWENTPDTGKQGCERDAELFDWVEQTLKDKNT